MQGESARLSGQEARRIADESLTNSCRSMLTANTSSSGSCRTTCPRQRSRTGAPEEWVGSVTKYSTSCPVSMGQDGQFIKTPLALTLWVVRVWETFRAPALVNSTGREMLKVCGSAGARGITGATSLVKGRQVRQTYRVTKEFPKISERLHRIGFVQLSGRVRCQPVESECRRGLRLIVAAGSRREGDKRIGPTAKAYSMEGPAMLAVQGHRRPDDTIQGEPRATG